MEIGENLKTKFNIAVDACSEAWTLTMAKKALDYHASSMNRNIDFQLANQVAYAINNAAIAVCNASTTIFNDAFTIDKDNLHRTISTIILNIGANLESIIKREKYISSETEEGEKEAKIIAARIAIEAIAASSDAFFKAVSNVNNTVEVCNAAGGTAATATIISSIDREIEEWQRKK